MGRTNAEAGLVIGDAHNYYVLRARDEARRRIFMTSHRMGRIVTPGVLVPLAEACARRSLDVTACYGKLQPGTDRQEAAAIVQAASARRVRLREVHDPKIHAKILAWDDDSIVVTSQNWLSRDPTESTLATELGVAIDCPGVADLLIRKMKEKMGVHRRRRRRGRKRNTNASPV